MRNSPSYRLRKLTIKTNKLIYLNSIKFSFFLFKDFILGLKMGLKPIYMDECDFFWL